MFGLEDQKNKKKPEPFIFDLEVELKQATKYKEVKDKVEDRIQTLKNALKSGETKNAFDEAGTLLHGYTSLLKVIARSSK